jgi:hypothetical protein
MDADLEELLLDILSCFHCRDDGWYHKDGEAEWRRVGEDLGDYLTELRQRLR